VGEAGVAEAEAGAGVAGVAGVGVAGDAGVGVAGDAGVGEPIAGEGVEATPSTPHAEVAE
jgi:hypothetical protein